MYLNILRDFIKLNIAMSLQGVLSVIITHFIYLM